ncbi:MAG TPA: hypothetical protein VNJ12_12370 [Candidatus Dormibacteraeota bacterium]|nr:hypothetical protein [Candidatus Dormibacteraeota bacterium]
MTPNDLRSRIDKIEECYEFMLGYAARGLPGGNGGASDEPMRHLLEQAAEALSGLPDVYRAAIDEKAAGFEPADVYRGFLAVLERDASDALAAMRLVLAQPVLGSQLIDNLNASSHLRAFLTDLFLIDEITV